MSTKSQTIFAVCFGLFLAVVVTVSLLFADKLPHATLPEGITGGYLFSFNVECVDESGKILKTQKFTGSGTLWSFEPPEVDGYTTTCASITRDDIIVLACIIYSKFATTMPSVNASASAISQVWSYIGEILFNMLVLVGTIKLSDQVVNKMMGV